MKDHKLGLMGIRGIFISLIYIGLLYQTGKTLDSIVNSIVIVFEYPNLNVPDNYFVSSVAFTLGVCCLIGSLILCVIDIWMSYKKHKHK